MRFSKQLYLFFLGFLCACSSVTINSHESANIVLDSSYHSTDLEDIILPYRTSVNEKMNAVIGYSETNLESFKPESPLGNFAADCVFEAGSRMHPEGFDDKTNLNSIALLNFGGLRAPINAGNISVGNVYELMPFDNSLTIIKLDSLGIMDMMNYLFESGGQPLANGNFQLSSQLKQGRVGGQLIDFTKPLYVYTSDYLADGGDKMNFLKDASTKWNSGVLLREVFIAAITAKKTIVKPNIEGRIELR